MTTRNFTIRKKRCVRGIHAFFLILGEPRGVRAPTETAGADDLFEIGVDRCNCDSNRIHHRNPDRVCIFILMDAPASETRLDELREQAWKDSVVAGKGVDVAGGPIPRKPGYYGEPVVKPPVWTWEIPLYFFFGGIGGMSAVIAFGAFLFHHVDLTRAAMWIAAIAGAVLSPILLIMDLGRPHLFLNMLRVFKHRSPMSMGAWILTAFGTCTVPGLIALELHAHQIFPGTLNQLLSFAAGIFVFGCGNFWSFARDLHRRAHRCHGDSRVVFASHIAADSFWNCRIGICRRCSGIVRTSNFRAQLSRILRRRC